MKFKKATIDVRCSRESGQNARGMYTHGITYTTRYIAELVPGMPVNLFNYGGPEYAQLHINNWTNNNIDGEVYIDGRMAYSFEIDGIVKNKYTLERFYMDGFWFLLEYRFLTRDNS